MLDECSQSVVMKAYHMTGSSSALCTITAFHQGLTASSNPGRQAQHIDECTNGGQANIQIIEITSGQPSNPQVSAGFNMPQVLKHGEAYEWVCSPRCFKQASMPLGLMIRM